MLLTRCGSVKTDCDLSPALRFHASHGNGALGMKQFRQQSHAFGKSRPAAGEIGVGVHRIHAPGLHSRQSVPAGWLARRLPDLERCAPDRSRRTSARSLPARLAESAPTGSGTTARLRGQTGLFRPRGAPSPEPSVRHSTAGQTTPCKARGAAWQRRPWRFRSRRHSVQARDARACAWEARPRPRRFRECPPKHRRACEA